MAKEGVLEGLQRPAHRLLLQITINGCWHTASMERDRFQPSWMSRSRRLRGSGPRSDASVIWRCSPGTGAFGDCGSAQRV